MTRTLMILAMLVAMALDASSWSDLPEARGDEAASSTASRISDSPDGPEAPAASGTPEDAASSALPAIATPAPAGESSEPAKQREAPPARPSPLSWLTDPFRKLLDAPGGAARPGARSSSAAARGRGAAKPNAAVADESAKHPEAPLPMATQTLPKPHESVASQTPPSEPVVATRFMGAPDRQQPEPTESGLSPEVGPADLSPGRMSVEQLLDKGAASLHVGAVSLAGNYFREAIGHSPDDPSVVVRAGVAALRHNRPELTVDLVEPAIERFAGADGPRQVLAMAKYRRGEYLGARALLQQALAVDKSSALSHYVLGCTLAKLDQREQAESHLRRAAELDPKYAQTR